MNTKSGAQNIQFLSGTGEMARLTRAKDWGKTAVGAVENWPQSLRTTLGILLNSKFPMFLWWGTELTCFYNDAYRPSLGKDGKHPGILGIPAAEAWPEIWDIIKPLIDQVLSGGEATWSEDQLIPIYRNGKIEDVYWTFSYSPVNDESGHVAGVLVTCSETTDKVITYKKLEESKKQLQFAIEAAELGTWDFNPATNKFTSNNRLNEWFGLPPEKELDLPVAINAIAEKDRQRIKDAIQRSLEFSSGGNYESEYTIINPVTQKETIVHAKGRAWFNDNNIAYRFNGTLQEVTEEVLALQEIKENEERLNIVIEASDLATWELNLQTSEVHYSDRYLNMLGYDSGTSLTHTQILKHLHPDDLDAREQAFKEAYDTGVLHYISRIILNDASVRWIEGRGKVFYDEQNKPLKLIGTTRDITEEKNYQHKLEEREQKFRLLADSMPQFVWTGDAEGNLNYFNQSVYNYSGLTPGQIEKDGWIQIVHPDEREENIAKWLHSIKTGADFLFEHRFRRHDGEYRWQLSRAIPQRDTNGKIQMWVGTSTDIEEQKTFTHQLEKQVQERTTELEGKNKELQAMNLELQSFAYVSSHDLQEPLRKIQVFATMINENEKEHLSENAKDYFHRMQIAAARMQTLIKDLLSYSRTNSTERIFEKVDLNEILEEVRIDLKEDIQQKHAIIEANELCEVNIIPFQFRQLLNNLIGNALKFSKPGTSPHIQVKSSIEKGNKLNIMKPGAKDHYCHITVSDNGIGFDPRYKEKIFEVFQRLHGKNEYKGTGIGLAIVKKIVENHHGIITATGELGKGATFDIYFPV